MAGQGKYTTYVPKASTKNERLGKLFKGNSRLENPFAELVESGDQTEAIQQTVARGEEFLRADKQQGDPGHFPQGVNMTYSGDENGLTVPDLTKVKWAKAGDPANAYTPDLSSPGPGETDPKSKDKDPQISVEDIKGEGYTPGTPGTSTARSPSTTTSQIKTANTLGTAQPLGKNSGNEPSGF